MKKTILILLMCFTYTFGSAQETVVTSGSRGSGSASSNQLIKKVVRLVDADTKEPVGGLRFSVVKANTVITGNSSNEAGYGVLLFRMNNYYSKLEINMNDNKYMNPRITEGRNKVAYKPLDSMIIFKSKKDIVDTVEVLLKKVPESKK